MPHTPDLFSTMPTKPWLGGQLPSDAWEGVRGAGVPLWAVPVATLAPYAAVGVVVRTGCPCELGRPGGIGAASGLALHRFLEGKTLALTASCVVVSALLLAPQARGPSQASGIDVTRRKSSKRCESLEPRGVRRPWN
ncbi:hypothetical protein ACWDO6_19165 [Streptomyces sp. NPDC003674]